MMRMDKGKEEEVGEEVQCGEWERSVQVGGVLALLPRLQRSCVLMGLGANVAGPPKWAGAVRLSPPERIKGLLARRGGEISRWSSRMMEVQQALGG